jgi:hypothetical protein
MKGTCIHLLYMCERLSHEFISNVYAVILLIVLEVYSGMRR